MFAISCNGEEYDPEEYGTIEDAVTSAVNEYAYSSFYVGKKEKPVTQESIWTPEDWFEKIHEHEDYSDYYGEIRVHPTAEQKAQLALQVRYVMQAWLDQHNLRPAFFIVPNPFEYVIFDGKACLQCPNKSMVVYDQDDRVVAVTMKPDYEDHEFFTGKGYTVKLEHSTGLYINNRK